MDLQLLERGAGPRHRDRQHSRDTLPADEVLLERLEGRLGRVHARQRIGIEDDLEARLLGRGLPFFDRENWRPSSSVIRNTLKLTGLYWRARKNAERVQIRRNDIVLPRLPAVFDGFTILQISDLHVDISPGAMRRLSELLPGLTYDLCVLTGDYRGKTYGPFAATIAGMARLCQHLTGPVYGVLGNHDTIRMVPALEEMGVRMLLNESETIERDGYRIHLGGIDDAHFYRLDNIEKVASRFPDDEFSILLSHTPEIYRQAAHAEFDLMLSGHTHGGQICLPGVGTLVTNCGVDRARARGLSQHPAVPGERPSAFLHVSAGLGTSPYAPFRLACRPEASVLTLVPRIG